MINEYFARRVLASGKKPPARSSLIPGGGWSHCTQSGTDTCFKSFLFFRNGAPQTVITTKNYSINSELTKAWKPRFEATPFWPQIQTKSIIFERFLFSVIIRIKYSFEICTTKKLPLHINANQGVRNMRQKQMQLKSLLSLSFRDIWVKTIFSVKLNLFLTCRHAIYS